MVTPCISTGIRLKLRHSLSHETVTHKVQQSSQHFRGLLGTWPWTGFSFIWNQVEVLPNLNHTFVGKAYKIQCCSVLAALHWVLLKTAGLEVLFAVEMCPVCGKQTSTIHPANKPRRHFTAKFTRDRYLGFTGSKIKTFPVQCMLQCSLE